MVAPVAAAARQRTRRLLHALALLGLLAGQSACADFGARLLPNPMLSRERSEAAAEPVDVAQLRSRYSEDSGLREHCESERPGERAFAQLEAAQWRALQTLSASWLERCPIDIDFRWLRSRALSALGRARESAEDMRWYHELLQAALESGDGASPESAYIVVSRPEEQALMRALQLTPVRPVWVADGLHGFEVRDTAGQLSKIYFNPARMSRLFRETPLVEEPEVTP